jgi:hypothetical protein
MTEYGFVEKPIIAWLAGDGIANKGLGWTDRDDAAMDAFEPERQVLNDFTCTNHQDLGMGAADGPGSWARRRR